MTYSPMENGSPDHGRDGKFRPGNKAAVGRGRPRSPWRRIFDDVVDEDRFRRHVEKLASAADAGERWAIELIASHKLGRPVDTMTDERLRELEEVLEDR